MFKWFALLLLSVLSQCSDSTLDELTRMKRTSCLVISRNYVQSINSRLGRLLDSVPPEDQMDYAWKLYGHLS
jgi:hypothetical protein